MMQKTTLILSAVVLALLNSGARTAPDERAPWIAEPLFTPDPAQIVSLALIALTLMVLMTRPPLIALTGWTWRNRPGVWPSHRAMLAVLTLFTIGGSLSMA